MLAISGWTILIATTALALFFVLVWRVLGGPEAGKAELRQSAWQLIGCGALFVGLGGLSAAWSDWTKDIAWLLLVPGVAALIGGTFQLWLSRRPDTNH